MTSSLMTTRRAPVTNPHLAAAMAPPVMAARRWLAETVLPPGLPLLNLSEGGSK